MDESSVDPGPAQAAAAGTFSEMIGDSRAANEAAPQVDIKKRGRPRKTPAPVPPTLSADPAAALPPPEPAFEIPSVVLKPVLQAPFKIARARTGFPGFDLPDAQAEELAPVLDQVLKTYLPQLDGKHAPLCILLGSLAMTFAMQYMSYVDWKAEEIRKAREPKAQPAQAPRPGGGIFDQQHVGPTLI